ncbi:DUF1003 domain-containing protein [Aliihoeflea sp. PC F10.4]
MATLEELARRWTKREGRAPNQVESRILRSAAERRSITRNRNESYDKKLSFGDRVADIVARFGGSWTFILGFIAFLVVWAVANTIILTRDAFDPYPFIFLNLVLSMVAALQAPIIMMSQNRQGARDRLEAEHDYAVNLKAELEIMALHEKLDAIRDREIATLHERVLQLTEALERIESRLTPR